MPWGTEIPLDPFFGIIATAAATAWGRCGSSVPRAFGGNMDNKELKPGTTLYLPVFTEGALFFAGDGHGVQGDGEVCITALETGVTGTFRLTVRKDMRLDWPFAETPRTSCPSASTRISTTPPSRRCARWCDHVCAARS